MITSRLLRPASRFLPATPSFTAPAKSHLRPAASLPCLVSRRRYATPSGSKDVAVRDALNEALAEELESNDKVFVLGEEVAQYNGAYVSALPHTALSMPSPMCPGRTAQISFCQLFSVDTLLTLQNRYKVTKGLLDRFGEKRVIDSPITESGFAGLTVGAALAGLHPVVCLHCLHTHYKQDSS